jgi:hypothetical protein
MRTPTVAPIKQISDNCAGLELLTVGYRTLTLRLLCRLSLPRTRCRSGCGTDRLERASAFRARLSTACTSALLKRALTKVPRGDAARRQDYQRLSAIIPFRISKSRTTHVKKIGGPSGMTVSWIRQRNF